MMFGYTRYAKTAYRNDWNLVVGTCPFLVPPEEWCRDAHDSIWSGQTWPSTWELHRERKLSYSVRFYALASCFSALLRSPSSRDALTSYYYRNAILLRKARLDRRAVKSLAFQRYLGAHATTVLDFKGYEPAKNTMVDYISHYINIWVSRRYAWTGSRPQYDLTEVLYLRDSLDAAYVAAVADGYLPSGR